MKKLLAATVVATALVVVQAVIAGAQTLPAPDQQFMIEAARAGIAEVELGRLAAQRAAGADVRGFAQRMVTDHGAGNQELMQLAQSKGVTLPQEMGPAHRATMDRLATMTGPAFDQAYMTEMVKAHQGSIALLTREAREGQDADVRAWAGKKLTTTQEHYRMAGDIHSRIAQVPAPQPPVVAVVPAPPVPAASPATVTTVTTTVVPRPPFCGGAYRPDAGTNFGSCGR